MSSSDTILFVSAIAGAAALFATKPSDLDIDRKVNEMLYSQIKNIKVDDALSSVVKVVCTSNSNDCINFVRATLDVDVTDRVLWKSVTIKQADRRLNCLGILNQLHCPGFLNKSDEAASADRSG